MRSNMAMRMMEARELKAKAVEQAKLHSEFGEPIHPVPPVLPVVVKTEAEQKMDAAFNALRDKLQANRDKANQIINGQ